MTQTIGRNVNKSDEARVFDVMLNSNTATTVIGPNKKRIYLNIDSCDAAGGSFVRLKPASVDNNKQGIYLAKNIAAEAPGRTFWEMSPDNIYTGEVSAISQSGALKLCITEY